MVKLVIMVQEAGALEGFDESWPQFLHLAESMPGLQREATSRVMQVLFGGLEYTFIHELFFDSQADLQHAMSSPQGVEAGRILQGMTKGKLALLIADHREDDLQNIRKYQPSSEEGGQGESAAS